MPTVAYTIGATSKLVATINNKPLLDIIVQNLSANNVYVGSDERVETTTGIKIVPNGYWANDRRAEPVYLVADAAGSDVRITYTNFSPGER